ncbi:MAG TPA: hypothetical protein VMM60_17740 [Ilumatobacter sp.]|nr:hypothetical protein [Ilumatobacter sp.]
MTEPDGETELDRALNALKPIAESADTSHVTPQGSDQRMAWDAVIAPDEEPAPDDQPPVARPRPVSSFQFDLGSALSNLGDPSAPAAAPTARQPVPDQAPEPAEPVVRSEPVDVPPLEVRRRVEPVVPPLETRRPAEPAPAVPPLETRRPAMPEEPAALDRRTPAPEQEHVAPRRTVFDEEASGAARAALHRVPLGSSIAEAAGVTAAPPTLPTAAPATASAVPFEPVAVEVPTVSDVRAYRTAQHRAAKRNSQGRLIGRGMLVLVVLGGVIGAALLFGRSYLFPTEWDPTLTPIVDDIQVARDAEFNDPIPLTVQPEAEYVATFARLVVPAGWESRVPEWRALGIAGGSPTPETVASSLAAAQLALFDPESETIFQLEGAEGTDLEAGLRTALEQGFEFQTGETERAETETTTEEDAARFLGVRSHEALLDRSLDDAFANRVLLTAGEDSTLPATADVPIPVAYDIAASIRLGPAIVAAATESGQQLAPGDYPPSVYAVFAPPWPTAALAAVLGEGEAPGSPVIALSSDDLRLVLGARVDPAVAETVIAAVTATSYTTFDRAGATCFALVFEFAGGATAQPGIEGVAAWASGLPVANQAVATPLDFTTMQVIGCDPGPSDPIAVDASWVDTVIDGQLARL